MRRARSFPSRFQTLPPIARGAADRSSHPKEKVHRKEGEGSAKLG